MMDDPLGLAILTVAALVVAIVALAKLAGLKASIEELKRRIGALERGDEAPAPKPVVTKSAAAVPPPLPAYVTQPKATTSRAAPSVTVPATPHRAFNWESILGVKLFAWIGGFAFFLGIVFFVKYAFENNWITPAMRIVAGGIIGAALICVSLLPRVRRYHVPAQSLCATGVLILYADVYAAHYFYNLVPLTAATALMWIVTGMALFLASRLEAQVVAWLALVASFATPFLFRARAAVDAAPYELSFAPTIFLIVYAAVLDCAFAFIVSKKRWTSLLTGAALGSLVLAFGWQVGLFYQTYPYVTQHIIFISFEGLFLVLCTLLAWRQLLDNWIISAMAIAGLGALIGMPLGRNIFNQNDMMPWMLAASGGIIAFAAVYRNLKEKTRAMATLVMLALLLTCLFEWMWCRDVLSYRNRTSVFLDGDPAAMYAADHLWLTVFRTLAIFFLFSVTPYLTGTKRFWPWLVSAIAASAHFCFVYAYARWGHLFSSNLHWLLPIAFALPAAFGVWYLIDREHVALSSGDSRLATQGAAVLAFVSLVFPVQFHREWITLGWAIEGLALILLFRWIPNRRLRAVALIVLAAAFVRLALNPAVLEYHPRSHTPIWNWYLYAYGVAAICFSLSARWFGEPIEKHYERKASAFLYSIGGIVLFLLMNIEIADYFSIGPTLTFSFSGNFARDMTYTISWSLFAFCLLVFGIAKNIRAVRLVAIGLLLVTFGKLFLHDLDSLNQLYRIGAFIVVAVIAIVASFVYQRFLLPGAKT